MYRLFAIFFLCMLALSACNEIENVKEFDRDNPIAKSLDSANNNSKDKKDSKAVKIKDTIKISVESIKFHEPKGNGPSIFDINMMTAYLTEKASLSKRDSIFMNNGGINFDILKIAYDDFKNKKIGQDSLQNIISQQRQECFEKKYLFCVVDNGILHIGYKDRNIFKKNFNVAILNAVNGGVKAEKSVTKGLIDAFNPLFE